MWLRSLSVRRAPYERHYADLDFVASSRNRRGVSDFFERASYVPERMFNAIHGRDRLNFVHPSGRWTVDVVFDELRMSHRLDLRGRLNGPAATVDLADLLLTKLQIWEINEKDLGDVVLPTIRLAPRRTTRRRSTYDASGRCAARIGDCAIRSGAIWEASGTWLSSGRWKVPA